MFDIRRLLALAACAACLLGTIHGARAADPDPDPDKERHLVLGNPSGAKDDQVDKNNFLMKKDWMSLSYNNSKGTPNWVAWNLVRSDFGDADRPEPDPFAPDGTLPAEFLKVKPADYKYKTTGFQRGHMCPNADRDTSKERATKTFVMTNMVPQTAQLNTKAWGRLEAYSRTLVDKKGKELFIVAGPAGKGGWSDEGYFNTTNGKVVVPAKCWKVILVLNAGDAPLLDRVTAETRVIAVIMPNDTTPTKLWGKYRVSLEDVEHLTGYTFFDKVPPAIRNKLREKVDDVAIPGE